MSEAPRYIVAWHNAFYSDSMTPQQAAIEAMRDLREEIRTGNVKVDVVDVDTGRRWLIGFHEHLLEVIECKERLEV